MGSPTCNWFLGTHLEDDFGVVSLQCWGPVPWRVRFFLEHWLVNRDPYVMVYYNLYISG